MQISIDNLVPDDVSMKSLKVLDKKLQMLADHAEFHVNINSVVGGGFKDPNDALVIGKRALELGFESTIGIIHDGDGQLKPLKPDEARVYFAMTHRKKTNYAQFDKFQEAIAQGRPNDWRCRAGSRYLYICEDGLVHYCSQQRGYPGVPLAGYTTEDVKREFLTAKSLLAELHHRLRAPHQLHRPLARAADADGCAGRRCSTRGRACGRAVRDREAEAAGAGEYLVRRESPVASRPSPAAVLHTPTLFVHGASVRSLSGFQRLVDELVELGLVGDLDEVGAVRPGTDDEDGGREAYAGTLAELIIRFNRLGQLSLRIQIERERDTVAACELASELAEHHRVVDGVLIREKLIAIFISQRFALAVEPARIDGCDAAPVVRGNQEVVANPGNLVGGCGLHQKRIGLGASGTLQVTELDDGNARARRGFQRRIVQHLHGRLLRLDEQACG